MHGRHSIILIPIALLAFGCASGPETTELNQKLRGMTKQELLSCMGSPATSTREGNMEFLAYKHRNVYDKYSYQCDANFILTDGKVSKLNILGDVPGTLDVTSGVCKALVAKCTQ